MKLFASILLSGLILLSVNRDALVFLSFKLNQAYIARNLCEKKDEVQNSCCGKCYLKKQITKNQDEANTKSTSIPENNFQPLFFETALLHKSNFFLADLTIKLLQVNVALPSCLFQSGIFHPPKI